MIGKVRAEFDILRESSPTHTDLIDFYNGLPSLVPQQLFGVWRGGDWRSGSRIDGLLERTGWWGKVFRSENDVDALVFQRSVRPLALLNRFMIWPFRLRENRRLVRHPIGRARIREVRFMGVVSAAMCYNHLPVIDHFRRVDESTVMGVMDFAGRTSFELCFWLERAE